MIVTDGKTQSIYHLTIHQHSDQSRYKPSSISYIYSKQVLLRPSELSIKCKVIWRIRCTPWLFYYSASALSKILNSD